MICAGSAQLESSAVKGLESRCIWERACTDGAAGNRWDHSRQKSGSANTGACQPLPEGGCGGDGGGGDDDDGDDDESNAWWSSWQLEAHRQDAQQACSYYLATSLRQQTATMRAPRRGRLESRLARAFALVWLLSSAWVASGRTAYWPGYWPRYWPTGRACAEW
jgi:hypothetical protein